MGIIQVPNVTQGGMTLLQETVANANSSISFSSIPGRYKHLFFVWQGIYHTAASNNFEIRFNGATSGYASSSVQTTGDTYATISTNNTSSIGGENTVFPFGNNITTSTNLGEMVRGNLFIENYASATGLKYIFGAWTFLAGSRYHRYNYQGTYNSTSAITSIDIVRITGSGGITNATNTSIKLFGVN